MEVASWCMVIALLPVFLPGPHVVVTTDRANHLPIVATQYHQVMTMPGSLSMNTPLYMSVLQMEYPGRVVSLRRAPNGAHRREVVKQNGLTNDIVKFRGFFHKSLIFSM